MLVVVDPGHGGTDPGARGIGGIQEASINLALADMVCAELGKAHRVAMTRTGDDTASLAYRCNLANAQKADVFLSIHCNASPNVLAHGTETYYLSDRARPLAEAIHAELVRLGLHARGVKRNGFYVLRHTAMPAVLVEVAFVTNPEDAGKLASQAWLAQAAGAIAAATRSYLEGRSVS